MTTLWATTLAASVGCYGLKLAGVSLPASLLSHPRVQRIAGLLPIAILSPLVVTNLIDANRPYSANWHTLAGVGAGAIALWRGRSLVIVFLVAIAVTAVLRAITSATAQAFKTSPPFRRRRLAGRSWERPRTWPSRANGRARGR